MALVSGIGAQARSTGEHAIARQSLDAPIADHLRERIIRGEMAAGARIHLPSLAASLGVSTTPLREALKILAEEEIVEWAPGRGARVAPIYADQTTDLFEVIATLEALAAERTAARISLAELAELDALHASMSGHFERQERAPYFEINSAIHDRILTLSANPTLAAAHARVRVRARRGRYLAIIDETRWREAMQEHEDLMQALRGRMAPRASEIWRSHLRNTGTAVLKAQLSESDPES